MILSADRCLPFEPGEGRHTISIDREWPRYCRKVYWTKMVQNGQNDHFGQKDLIPNRILVPFGLKGSILVHSGPPTVLWPFLN